MASASTASPKESSNETFNLAFITDKARRGRSPSLRRRKGRVRPEAHRTPTTREITTPQHLDLSGCEMRSKPVGVVTSAVTRDGTPVRCWTFPGNENDQRIIRTVKDDLAGWNLHRMVWVANRGFASAANRAYLTRGGGHYIHAEKLRHTNTEAAAALARPGRYRTVAGNLRVKEVAVAPGGDGDGNEGARAQRFVVCHNPEQADRDAAVRARLVAHLEELITGSGAWTGRRRDEFVGSLKTKPGCAATCAAPSQGCSGSTTPPSRPRPTWTASGCCAPATSR